MLAWTLTRPDSHIRAMLAGVAESEITSSLFPVSLISAGGSSGAASLTGSAPCVGDPGYERHAEIGDMAAQ